MERAAPKSKGTIVLRYLQKAATFTITNNPHSPRGSAGERIPTIRGLSSIIPSEARHKKRSDDTFDEEPTSPKVTCIGQIKHKKTTEAKEKNKKKKKKKIPSGLTRMLSQRVSPDHKEVEMKNKKKKKELSSSTPALGQLKKFTSGRETLTNFDWEKAVRLENSDEEEKEDVMMNIYHSAPLVLGGDVMEAKHKEIGLWRRRSIAALMPIEIVNK